MIPAGFIRWPATAIGGREDEGPGAPFAKAPNIFALNLLTSYVDILYDHLTFDRGIPAVRERQEICKPGFV